MSERRQGKGVRTQGSLPRSGCFADWTVVPDSQGWHAGSSIMYSRYMVTESSGLAFDVFVVPRRSKSKVYMYVIMPFSCLLASPTVNVNLHVGYMSVRR